MLSREGYNIDVMNERKKNMSSLFDGIEGYKLRGRKLILEWGKLKLELSKLPYGSGPKDPLFSLCGSQVVLANVYEGPDGHMVDEILGVPAGVNGHVEGHDICEYLVNDSFWMTPSEAQSGKLGENVNEK